MSILFATQMFAISRQIRIAKIYARKILCSWDGF